MKGMVWCQCSNINCEWEDFSEPYGPCPNCQYVMEPVSDTYDLHPEEEYGDNDD